MTATPPFSLKLEFSKAADRPRIDRLFGPAIKNNVDPNSFVAQREDHVLDRAVASGCAAFLSDAQGDIQTMGIAYHLHHDKNAAPGATPDYTELGSAMARLAGYNSARLVSAALTLKEWWANEPKNFLVAEIDFANGPSTHTFHTALGWQRLTDPQKMAELQALCDDTIAPADRGAPVNWFYCDQTLMARQARVLLDFMDQGGLLNKKTGSALSVDFSALAGIGLYRTRLEAIAAGEIRKPVLAGMAP